MGRGEIVVRMSSEESKLFFAMKKIQREEEGMAKGFSRIGESSRQAAREQQQMARAAQRVFREAATPQQKYNARQKELLTLLGKGKIDAKLYGQALAKAEAEKAEAIRRNTGANQEAVGAAREASRQKQEALRREQEIRRRVARQREAMHRRGQQITRENMTAQERYNSKLRELRTLLRAGMITQQDYSRAAGRARRELEGVEAAGEKAFGADALSKVGQFAASFASVTVAIGGITTALREMEQVRREAGQRLAQSRIDIGSLAQLARTPEEMQKLVQMAQRVRASGGAASDAEAAQLVFSLVSAGAKGQVDLFSQMGATGLLPEPAKMAKASKTLLTSMGEAETGGMRAIVSKAFGASAASPARAEELLEAASRAAGSAKALGLTDEELLAATALTATSTGSAEMGGTQVAALLKSIEKQRGEIGGESLQAMVASIDAKQLGGEELFKFFGRQEAVQAYRVLRDNAGQLQEQIAAVQQAEQQDLTGTMLKLSDAVPALRAARLAAQAKGQREVGEQQMATMNQVADAMQDAFTTDLRTRGRGELRIWAANKWSDYVRWIHGDETFARRLQGIVPDAGMRQDVQEVLQPTTGPSGQPGPANPAAFPLEAGVSPTPSRGEPLDLRGAANLNKAFFDSMAAAQRETAAAQRDTVEAQRETNRLLQEVVNQPKRNPVLSRPNEDEPLGVRAP